MKEFYGVMIRYAIVAAMAVTIMSLASCTKSTDWGSCPGNNSEQFNDFMKRRTTKLVKTGKQDGLKYEVYDLGTDNNAHLVYAYSPSQVRGIEFVVQQDANNAWELYDLDAPDTFCWGCLGDCINDVVGTALSEEPAVTYVGAALCPECAVGAVVGVAIGCASLQF